MSITILDFDDFVEGGLPLIGIIAGVLLIVQAVFCFLIWRTGEKAYLVKFISFILGAIPLILGGIGYAVALGSGEAFLVYLAMGLFILLVPVSIGLQIVIFVRDTWFPEKLESIFPKDTTVETIKPEKLKEAKG